MQSSQQRSDSCGGGVRTSAERNGRPTRLECGRAAGSWQGTMAASAPDIHSKRGTPPRRQQEPPLRRPAAIPRPGRREHLHGAAALAPHHLLDRAPPVQEGNRATPRDFEQPSPLTTPRRPRPRTTASIPSRSPPWPTRPQVLLCPAGAGPTFSSPCSGMGPSTNPSQPGQSGQPGQPEESRVRRASDHVRGSCGRGRVPCPEQGRRGGCGPSSGPAVRTAGSCGPVRCRPSSSRSAADRSRCARTGSPAPLHPARSP
jgi:hypothetical protein